ncbi:MAG: hypothetical protein B6D61_04540 [Bacteroidetes bacterium 4484_249]|nr:MAG: hypothetical protein B6D61_04540 [Bacteroidetes bacterium 4484_249]
MKSKILYLFFSILILGISSCEYSYIEPEISDSPPVIIVSYANDIQPIFDEDCINCHSSGGDFPDLTSANAYTQIINNGLVNLTNAEESIIYYYPGSEDHDWTGYSTEDGNLILNWIKEGAQNN